MHNHYADVTLDRVAHLRADEAWLRTRLEAPETIFVPVWRSKNLVVRQETPQGVMMREGEARDLVDAARTTVLLGLRGEIAHFAVDISHVEEKDLDSLRGAAEFVDLRSVGAVMDRGEASILAYAKGIMHWHARHGFCGACGAPTRIREAGHLRECGRCGALHFPRTDPAVIMLVARGDRVLLGRKAEWMDGMYSTLAGFVEPGESLEHAVAREVMEEAGVAVSNIRYHSSQPWPFPASLMLGFHADADTDAFTRNEEELEDLRWFTRKELAEGGAGISRRPRSDSIARRLIDEWIRRG